MSLKRGGGGEKNKGVRKKRGAPHPPFFKKGGARSTGTPSVYAPVYITIYFSQSFYNFLSVYVYNYLCIQLCMYMFISVNIIIISIERGMKPVVGYRDATQENV